MTLVAETTSGVMYAAEAHSLSGPDRKSVSALPEKLGRQTATELIEEVVQVGSWLLSLINFWADNLAYR